MKFAINFFSVILLLNTIFSSAQVGVGTISPDASSVLDVYSTTKGALLPRMTSVQMNAIPSPAQGLIVYCQDCSTKGLYIFSESVWSVLNASDATSTVKGLIQLSGDLSGTASTPTVPGLATKEPTSNKSISIITDATSDIKFPSVKAVKTYVDNTAATLSSLAGINALTGNWNKDSEVALLIESGQSNAESAAIIPISLPTMNNVYGLSRVSNFSTSLTDVTWSPFSSDGMSLGRNYGTGFTSIATEFARLWQAHINSGNSYGLPNLYIIRIPYSGQSIGINGDGANARWNILNANLNALTIDNLAFYQQYILQLAINNITRTTGRSIRIIGNIWVHGEGDSKNSNDAMNYQSGASILFRSLDKVCNTTVPICFIYNRSNDKFDPGRFLYQDIINSAFDRLAQDRLGSFIIDPYSLSMATPQPTVNKSTQGIYKPDFVHFTSSAIVELGYKLFERIVINGIHGPSVRNDLAPAKLNFLDSSSSVLTSQVSAAQTTANAALATADAALGFSTIYASTYLASTSNQVTLPGYSIFDYATTGTASNLTVTRDSSDDKKYFGFANYVIPGKFKYLYFTNFKSDTKYCGFQIRAKKTFPFGVLLRLVPNATPASTFQSTGYNYLYVAVASHPSDYAYTTAITAGSGDGTTNQAADGTSASANTPKVIIYAFDSKASAASYRTLSVSQINTTTHPNFGSTGSASEIDLKYTIEPNGANGVIAVKYKNITETNWTTLYSYTIPSSTTLGSELTSGGNGGFAFGIGNRNSNIVMQDCKVSAITPLSLE
jgi:hypothetical protein